MGANGTGRPPLLPYAAKSGQQGAGGLPTPLSAQRGVIGIEDVFCLNCGRAIPNPNLGQKYCRKALGQKGSCKDRYWSRGLRRLSKVEKRLRVLEESLDIAGSCPDFKAVRDAFYIHRDQIDHSLGK